MVADPGSRRLRVVVCEPYATGSHQAWAEGLAAHSAHDVRLVTHAGGFWKWRMQGAALTLAADIRRLVADGWGPPDVLLVSDMVHVPALLGLARDLLAGVPVVVYFHENQLTYPTPEGGPVDLTYGMTNWLSMTAADRVVFNSAYHRTDALGAVPRLLRRFPDHRHDPALVEDVAARSSVLPVGINTARFGGPRTAGDAVDDRPVVLWNHRWEYDKDPAAFFAALDRVVEAGIDFGLIVAGTSYQTVPPDFARARERFAALDRIVAFGTASDGDYPALLRRADVVVSTARHEFFGVAVAEAIAAGALPILPDRLSYPELVPHPHETYLYDSPEGLVARLSWALTDHPGRRAAAAVATKHVGQFDWAEVAPRYDRLLAEVAAGAPARSLAGG
jgi:glycosyltransferase involved in cell wall biosynthesis